MSGTVRTKSGRLLSEADFERMADEAEAGIDVSAWDVRRGRPSLSAGGRGKSPRVGARVSQETYHGFLRRVTAEGNTTSEVVRALVEAYAATAETNIKRAGSSVAAGEIKSKQILVQKTDAGWTAKRAGDRRSSIQLHATQAAAEKAAKELARRSREAEVIMTEGRDKIRSSDTVAKRGPKPPHHGPERHRK